VLALFDCGTALIDRDELEVVGSEGSLFIEDPWHCLKPGIELRRRGGAVERIALPLADSYQLELENVSDVIRGRGELLLGRPDAVAQARVLGALRESAASGVAVSLTLTK
jgi:predicted dehydrogenase